MQPNGLVQSPHMRGRAQLALEAIRRHRYAYGCSPSLRELGAAIGVTSPARVSAIVRQLDAAGLVIRRRSDARGITLPRPLDNHATSELLLELAARGVDLRAAAALPRLP